jgi:hypothetical protein
MLGLASNVVAVGLQLQVGLAAGDSRALETSVSRSCGESENLFDLDTRRLRHVP